ncbi:MAG: hypothetical protein HRU21_13410, partial [Pseudomonadales bacterium]|nr:hypothetical protein [Pseudomonadales bacterium]
MQYIILILSALLISACGTSDAPTKTSANDFIPPETGETIEEPITGPAEPVLDELDRNLDPSEYNCSDELVRTDYLACLSGDGILASPRANLSFAQLSNSGNIGLVNYSAFAIPAEAKAPSHNFSGTLSFAAHSGSISTVDVNDPPTGNSDDLPDFSFDFVQQDSYFIPLQRTVTRSNDSNNRWEYIVGPGRVWDESGDQGMSRVSFPFALQQRNQNCTHNGVMSFLFDANGISELAYQIAQETCANNKFDLTGKVSASYTPNSFANAEAVIVAYRNEVFDRIPVEPLANLTEISS